MARHWRFLRLDERTIYQQPTIAISTPKPAAPPGASGGPRDHARTEAQALVTLEREPFVRERCLLALACVVGFASRALLIRTG